MFPNWIKNLKDASQETTEQRAYWLERLSALLLVEIARSDTHIDEQEMVAIKQALEQSANSLSASEIDDIILTATQDANSSISLHEQYQQINDSFSREQKLTLVEQMWRVALADGDLDKYEEYTIRELCERLHIDHKYFIQAKLKIVDA